MKETTISYLVTCFIISLFLSSCASILNGPAQKIYITTDKNVKITGVDKKLLPDSSWIGKPQTTRYFAIRGRDLLKVDVEVKGIKKTIFFKPRNSFAYWFNIPENDGLGMLVDKNNPKRYGYQSKNYLSANDTSLVRTRFAPIKKGTLNLCLSPSIVTVFNVKTPGKPFNGGGILGASAELDYYYKDNQYYSGSLGAATSRIGIVEYFGSGFIESGKTLFVNLRNNHVVGSFDLGYGINLSQLKWVKSPIGDSTKGGASLTSTGLGLSLSALYRAGNYFRLGLLYQPNLWNTSFKPAFSYQHFISLNLIWAIPIRE